MISLVITNMRNQDIIGLHTQFFRDLGFELDNELMMFQKPFPLGFQMIFVQFTEHENHATLEYNLGIRIHEVEELIHQFLPTLSGFSERSITLVQTLDKIGKILPKQFIINNDYELAKAIETAEKFLITDGLNWLDKMEDPLNLEIAFYERKAKTFKTSNFVYNAFRATALSKLYNPADYPYLRQIFLEAIEEKELTPFTIASYLKFLNYLDNLD